MAKSDVGLAADNMADYLAEKDALEYSNHDEGVLVIGYDDYIDIINTLRACANEIDAYVNGDM